MITVDFARLNIEPGSKILDIGCGSGRHVAEAARADDVVCIGSDLCFDDLLKARDRMHFHENLGETGGGPWGLLTSDVTRLPFDDASFDLVICSEVLEHVPDHARAMKELLRVLKPGKDLVVSVPRFLPERVCWALADDYYNSNGGHIRIYKKPQLIGMLRDAGAEYRGSHYAHGLHSPYWWLKCLMGPTRSDSKLVNLYHRFLVWDMMDKPKLTRTMEKALDPFIGKSLVVYCKKNGNGSHP